MAEHLSQRAAGAASAGAGPADQPRGSGGFLQDAIAEVRRELAARPLDEDALRVRLGQAPPVRDFAAALRATHPSLIAEVKRASPSAGHIADADPALQASAYERAGAAAISVLTLPRHFGGSIEDLHAVRSTVDAPVLRKDFLVHPSQLLEARVEGADAVLLIVSALSDDELRSMLAMASELGLAALVETHDAGDLERATAAGAAIIGVNARDLVTLDIDVDRALDLLARVPPGVLKVIESGVSTREQVVRAVAAGADAVLIGEALMRAADPTAKVRELLGRNEDR